jgi:hypothetical protein
MRQFIRKGSVLVMYAALNTVSSNAFIQHDWVKLAFFGIPTALYCWFVLYEMGAFKNDNA